LSLFGFHLELVTSQTLPLQPVKMTSTDFLPHILPCLCNGRALFKHSPADRLDLEGDIWNGPVWSIKG